MIIESRAFARAGLLGNPSDVYFGKSIGICVRNFDAAVSICESAKLKIASHPDDENIFQNINHMIDTVKYTGYYGGERLIKAAIKVFYGYCLDQHLTLDPRNFTIRYRSSIPRQVGLAGSSAIVTAAFHSLMKFYHVVIPKEILPNLILSAERDELHIQAGLMDRVVQVYEGCIYMDLNEKHIQSQKHGHYVQLDPSRLPSLYIAYKKSLSKVSGHAHQDLRTRHEHGDPVVIGTLMRIAELAEQGKDAIEKGDHDLLRALINENFDLRKKIMPISKNNLEMITTARRCGASAKFAGSGGAVIGTYSGDAMYLKIVTTFQKLEACVIRPEIVSCS
jgi:glucuronokinase